MGACPDCLCVHEASPDGCMAAFDVNHRRYRRIAQPSLYIEAASAGTAGRRESTHRLASRTVTDRKRQG
ncbi:hypothetical protein K788_0008107 [Paraburkholderia caribensis MBA4]|uniref:Uncharacterized protein n=1 Tax=Paraburkholderia caribensis MBA4 TaxID=1323664 RepID=A0A0P0RGA1_9BURK|nr:hypothetical protein K788_0008107 [Paraburkholderia caribensis MBA4]